MADFFRIDFTAVLRGKLSGSLREYDFQIDAVSVFTIITAMTLLYPACTLVYGCLWLQMHYIRLCMCEEVSRSLLVVTFIPGNLYSASWFVCTLVADVFYAVTLLPGVILMVKRLSIFRKSWYAGFHRYVNVIFYSMQVKFKM